MRRVFLGLLLLLGGCYNGYSAYPYYSYGAPPPPYGGPPPGYGGPPPGYYGGPPPGYGGPPPGYYSNAAANDPNNCGTPDEPHPCRR